MSIRTYPKNGTLIYNIAGREPWSLPDVELEVPAPPELPNAPSSVSLITLILPPVIMIAGSIISAITMGNNRILVMLPMMLMGLGYPAANLIAHRVQKKKYEEQLETRKQAYIKTLREFRSHIEGLMHQQQRIMQEEFPPLQRTLEIGLARGEDKRLWWRRPGDYDFLNLRVGMGVQKLSFSILPPRTLNNKDPLSNMPFELIEHYQHLTNMPFLVDLKRLGSVVIFGDSFRNVIRLVRRMLVDVIVHHSPEDVHLVVLANRRNAIEEWEWLKWAPHTHLLDGTQERQNLLFTTDKINSFLDELKRLFYERLEAKSSYHGGDKAGFTPSYVVVLDDKNVRSHEDIRRIAADGHEVGIYLIFVTDYNVPSSYRARVEVDDFENLDYLETYETQSAGNQKTGRAELVSKSKVEPLTRTLAGLDVAGGKSSAILPSTVRVVDLIEGDPYSVPEIVERWRNRPEDSKQVLMPVGQYVDRDGLATYEIDFRPESIGGKGAYHAMMIGTTGSGKSIFMQSLVLAAAHRYSPKDINFMFMDFKAGAAELKKVSELPHSVGMVTDLSPALADRALQALENELSRRKQIFDSAGKITDIWDYNRRFPEQRMPHLLVMIDEFAEGIKILPNLVERLKELGRQGRAFGMYFFLANQEVNSAVDALKANVSWYVLLKVNRREEMSLIERRLPVPPGRGRGYIKVKSEITSIQSAYAGLPADIGDQDNPDINEYVISTFGPEGRRNELFRFDPRQSASSGEGLQTELELLLSVINEAAYTLNIPHAKPIYTEPLPEVIPYQTLLKTQEVFRFFNGEDWPHRDGEKNVIPMGYLDIPKRCIQPPFSLDFNESGGHLWIIGTPGSGKNMVLFNLAMSLCLTHTPQEINLYALEFGNGQLSIINALPHTGAVIRAHEKERVDRLLRFLQDEMRLRTEIDWRTEGKPEIYLLINNVADFRVQYPDQAEDLGRFIRSGGSVGIHVIISSNRGSELPRSLSGNITHRIVLQLTESQEYLDVLNTRVAPLTMRTEGRGYLFRDGEVAECQISMPTYSLLREIEELDFDQCLDDENNEVDKDQLLNQIPNIILSLGRRMQDAWGGVLPDDIQAMQKVLSLNAFDAQLEAEKHSRAGITLPLGLTYDNLKPFYVDVRREGPYWTILGGRQSGKSTALTSIAYYLRKEYPEQSCITLIPFRRGPLSQIKPDDRIHILLDHREIVEFLDAFVEETIEQPEKMHVLLMDDAGVTFSSGNMELIQALDRLGSQLNMVSNDNFLIVIADLYSNLKSTQTYSSTFLKLFRQSQTGIFFSMDDSDMQWFNTRVSLSYKKNVKWLTGRGFYVSKGEAEYIQCPLVEPDDVH
jgi:S-DNA-T family DNA segregation ATPase FtsK/SpoIIIE